MQNLIQAVMKKWGREPLPYVYNRNNLLLTSSAMMAMLLVGCSGGTDAVKDDNMMSLFSVTINAVSLHMDNDNDQLGIDDNYVDFVFLDGLDDLATADPLDYYLLAPLSMFVADVFVPPPTNERFILLSASTDDEMDILYQSGLEESEFSEVVFNLPYGSGQLVISITADEDETSDAIEFFPGEGYYTWDNVGYNMVYSEDGSDYNAVMVYVTDEGKGGVVYVNFADNEKNSETGLYSVGQGEELYIRYVDGSIDQYTLQSMEVDDESYSEIAYADDAELGSMLVNLQGITMTDGTVIEFYEFMLIEAGEVDEDFG